MGRILSAIVALAIIAVGIRYSMTADEFGTYASLIGF